MATPYDVRGKTPVAAWIPSLDDVGNGTTTLTDLIAGDLTGTLTNMDPPTDWVANTEAGGIRAIDFDGTNDFIATTAALLGAGDVVSLSLWIKPNTFGATGNRRCLFSTRLGDTANSWALETFSAGGDGSLAALALTQPGVFRFTTSNVLVSNQWQNVVLTKSGSNLTVYRNAEEVYSITTAAYSFADNTSAKQIGRINAGGLYYPGLMDDIRVFANHFVLADAAYTWNGGEGRGIVQPSGNIRRRQEESMMMASRSGL